MKVFKFGPESFPGFMFVYDEIDKFYDALRIKSGPLSKWSFRKVSKSYADVYHDEYRRLSTRSKKRSYLWNIWEKIMELRNGLLVFRLK